MNLAHPHFADPVWLWLAVAGPVVLVALHRHAARARRRQLARIAAPEFIAPLTRSHSPARRAVKQTLLAAAVGIVGLALARPQWGEQPVDETQVLGDDVVFVLDCSSSMLASDVVPSRLNRAKLAILDFVERHGSGRVGLVAFAGQAFLQCPLTSDFDAFADTLRAMDENTIPVKGTDVGRALDEAFLAMDKDDATKLIVLLTDGEDLENGGVEKAKALAAQGAVIFTIGVGTAAGSVIQVTDPQQQSTLLRDAGGEVVRSRLDEDTLRAIAAATGGEYHPLGALGEGLARVRTIMESREFAAGRGRSRRGVERFHLFVATALALVVAESLLGTRRRTA
jgi:Ca-activated chloride channel family protein